VVRYNCNVVRLNLVKQHEAVMLATRLETHNGN